MKHRKVVKLSNLPSRSPLWLALLLWLFLDRVHAAGWIWGAVGVVWVLLMIRWIAAQFIEDETDIFRQDGK